MISAAHLLVQAIVVDGIGRSLADFFSGFDNPVYFLLICVAALVVIGFMLEGIPAILVSAPILLPIAVGHGVDPLQFGILVVIATSIGVMMPPVGIGFYVACAVGDAPPNATMKPCLIYNVFLILGLAIVTLFPMITLWLPVQLGMH